MSMGEVCLIGMSDMWVLAAPYTSLPVYEYGRGVPYRNVRYVSTCSSLYKSACVWEWERCALSECQMVCRINVKTLQTMMLVQLYDLYMNTYQNHELCLDNPEWLQWVNYFVMGYFSIVFISVCKLDTIMYKSKLLNSHELYGENRQHYSH